MFESTESEGCGGLCLLEMQAEVCLSGSRVNIAAFNHLIHSYLLIIKGGKMRREVSEQKHKEVARSYRPTFSIIICLPRHQSSGQS